MQFQMNQPRERFHFNPPISIKGSWKLGLSNLEVFISIFDTTEENNKFELFKMQKSEMRLKRNWIYQILQLPVYKMKDLDLVFLMNLENM